MFGYSWHVCYGISLYYIFLHLHTPQSASFYSTILANNNWDSAANDSLLTVQKTKEEVSLTPPSPPSINVASIHHVRGCWLCRTRSKELTKNSQGRRRRERGSKSEFILKWCPSIFGQDCNQHPYSPNVRIFRQKRTKYSKT